MIDAPLLLIPHNWDETVKQRLSWKTDILVTRSGIEQRRRVRANPLETLTYHLTLLSAAEQSALRALFLNATDLRVAVPRWEDALTLALPGVEVGDTLIAVTADVGNRQLAGPAVIFWEGEGEEEVEITAASGTTVTLASGTASAWPAGVLIVPVVYLRLASPIDGETYGQLQGHVTVSGQVESNVLGLIVPAEGEGDAAAMVPASVAVYLEGTGSEWGSIALGDIQAVVVEVTDAGGNLVPDPEITTAYAGSNLDIYPTGQPGVFNIKNLMASGSSTENVDFTAGGVTVTVGIALG